MSDKGCCGAVFGRKTLANPSVSALLLRTTGSFSKNRVLIKVHFFDFSKKIRRAGTYRRPLGLGSNILPVRNAANTCFFALLHASSLRLINTLVKC